jgi:hypothetical protein
MHEGAILPAAFAHRERFALLTMSPAFVFLDVSMFCDEPKSP